MSADAPELAQDLLHSFKTLENGYAHLVHLGDDLFGAVEVHPLIVNAINPIVRIKIATTSEDVHFMANSGKLLRKLRDMGRHTANLYRIQTLPGEHSNSHSSLNGTTY
ncbi:Uncharacterised protein [uncultured archaeon]|nr:Uncharacterised protein [uncultured archaeon]